MGRVREEKKGSEKKEDAGAGKGRKVAIHCVFFPMICCSGGSKSRLARAAGAEPAGQIRDCTKHSKSKCTKRTILRPLLEVEMSKSARCCGAKHISKSKV